MCLCKGKCVCVREREGGIVCVRECVCERERGCVCECGEGGGYLRRSRRVTT